MLGPHLIKWVKATATRSAGPKAMFVLLSTASRVLWALYTLYLATHLGQTIYGEFIFLQITAAFFGQILVGSFSNLIAFQMARAQTIEIAQETHIHSSLYVIASCLLAAPIIAILQFIHIMPGGTLTALSVVAVAIATAIGGQSIAFACSQNAYREASLLSIIPFIVYVALISNLRHPSAELIAASVAAAQATPFFATAAWLAHRKKMGANKLLRMEPLRSLLRTHKDAFATNVSSLPQQMVIWMIARNLVSFGGPNEFSRYGIANQLNNLFLFFPISFAPMFISWIGKNSSASFRVKISFLMAIIFASIGIFAAILIFILVGYFHNVIPKEFVSACTPMAVALLMAGLVAARSPFAWLNQIDRDYRAEWLISIAATAVMSVSLLPAYSYRSEVVLIVRTIAALVGLTLSAALLIARNNRNPR